MNKLIAAAILAFASLSNAFAGELGNSQNADPALLTKVVNKTCKLKLAAPNRSFEASVGTMHLKFSVSDNMLTGTSQASFGKFAYGTWQKDMIGVTPAPFKSVTVTGKTILIVTSLGAEVTLNLEKEGSELTGQLDPTKSPAFRNPQVAVIEASICE